MKTKKDRIGKLKDALFSIANDLPISQDRLQNIAKNALEYDKIVYLMPHRKHT